MNKRAKWWSDPFSAYYNYKSRKTLEEQVKIVGKPLYCWKLDGLNQATDGFRFYKSDLRGDGYHTDTPRIGELVIEEDVTSITEIVYYNVYIIIQYVTIANNKDGVLCKLFASGNQTLQSGGNQNENEE